MINQKISWASVAIVAISAWCSVAAAQDFRPFTTVQNVCPTCPYVGYDRLTLKDGQIINAVVVADNPMFYVLRRNSEFRAVGHDKVAKIERAPDAARGGDFSDQILAKDGFVVAGKIVRERDDTGMFEIKVPPNDASLFIYKSLIQVVFKAGKLYYSADKKT